VRLSLIAGRLEDAEKATAGLRCLLTRDELRRKNARLRDKIDQVLEKHPELRDVTEELELRQGLHVQVRTPFLERVQGKLQERAHAIIERRPELAHYFDD
jgi:hypothetical protein